MNEKLTEILDSVLHSPPADTFFSPAGPPGGHMRVCGTDSESVSFGVFILVPNDLISKKRKGNGAEYVISASQRSC